MLPVALLIALMILTWAAAVVAVYVDSEPSGPSSDDQAHDHDYYDAA